MSQYVWHINDIGNVAQGALNMALAASDNPSSEFVRGAYVTLAVLCQQFGAPAPRLPNPTTVDVIDAIARELIR